MANLSRENWSHERKSLWCVISSGLVECAPLEEWSVLSWASASGQGSCETPAVLQALLYPGCFSRKEEMCLGTGYSGIGNSCPFCTYTFFNVSSLAESHLSVCQVALAKIGSQNLSVVHWVWRKESLHWIQTDKGSPASCRLILLKDRQNRLFVSILYIEKKIHHSTH